MPRSSNAGWKPPSRCAPAKRCPATACSWCMARPTAYQGAVVDQYGDILSVQFTTTGVERWKETIADHLLRLTGCKRLYERSDASVRALEGLASVRAWTRSLSGSPSRHARDDPRERVETDRRRRREIPRPATTSDQRDNRARFAQLVRQYGCKSVLNCFSYTGGFSVAALAGGAQRRDQRRLVRPRARTRATEHVELGNGLRRAQARGTRCRRQHRCCAAC